MKPIAIAATATFLLSAAPTLAGNLSEPILEQEPIAAFEPAQGDGTLVARDAIVEETRNAGDGSILVPLLFLVFGGAVLAGG